MATKTKEGPAEAKKETIDAMLYTKIRDQPLLDLAFLQPGLFMERITKRIAALNKAIDAQIRKGITPCLKRQKEIITEILRRLDENELNSEDLRTLLLRLRLECKD